ncbi:glycosyl hydrolase [Actinomycetospora succinea]|uniref:glycosyl hydrolase n=1 Tax=Actinomycetospora succinea TaxID=663603 RepID=UPI001061E474|nr:glycosyl hydrolase [Actinomycetospora succinea]
MRTALTVLSVLILAVTVSACDPLTKAAADELSRSGSPMTLGLVADLRGHGLEAGRVDQVASSGVGLVREEWGLGDLDGAVFDVAASRGLSVLPVLAPAGGQNTSDWSAARSWMTEFARQFGPGGTFWAGRSDSRFAPTALELLNEPYLAQFSGGRPAADTYAEFVKYVVPSIREANPNVRVLLSADVSTGVDDREDWIGALYRAAPDLNGYFDAIAIHPYGNDPVEECDPMYRWSFCRMSTIRSRFDEHGARGKPFWITEVGNPTSGGAAARSEDEQAKFLAEYIGIARRSGYVSAFVVYHLRDSGCTDDRECFFGITHVDGSPKPAWRTLLLATGKEES